MPSLKLLCLHGTGCNSEIMRTQMTPLLSCLEREHLANLSFLEGQLEAEAGPGIEGFYDGPYYSFYNWPPTNSSADQESIDDAIADLQTKIEEDGPFDGLLGFSHGGTLVAEFLRDWALRNPFTLPPIRCAIFICSFAPFRMHGKGEPKFMDMGFIQDIKIPTLHIVGKKDFAYKYGMDFYRKFESQGGILVTSEKGHEVPGDEKTLRAVLRAFGQLSSIVQFGI